MPAPIRRPVRLACALVTTLALAGCKVGQLEDPRTLPEAPRPTIMSELTHPDGEVTVEQTSGVLNPRGYGDVGHVGVHVGRIAVEQPVYSRLVFVGGSYEAAYGAPATATTPKIIGSNVELSGRTVWATRNGLAFGGGLGVMLPTAQFDRNSPVQNLANAATALRPWDYAFFREAYLGIRPSLDLRYIAGPVIIQAHEVFDVTFDTENAADYDLDVVTAFYVAVRVRKELAVGAELAQLYRVSANISDERRSSVTVAPMMRFIFARFQPAISFITNIGGPFYDGANHVWAVKTTLTALW